jgi:hypothetical protein
MNVSIGPVKYDVDNDDKVDKDLSNRGYLGGTLVTYIVRTFYLPAQEKANDEAMKPGLAIPAWQGTGGLQQRA